MIVVEPFNIIGGLLTSSNIPEPDIGETVWAVGTLSRGERRIVVATHKLYEVVAETTTDDPVTGSAKAIPTWVEVSYTNKYRMFDQVNSSQSTRAAPIIVEITSPRGFDSVAIFNATGVTSVRYHVQSSGGVTIYDRTLSAVDNSERVNWWPYFFLPIVQRYKFFVNDIPRTQGSRLTVTVNGAASVSVGTLVLGRSLNLGVACYGTSFRYINLTKVDENDFGDLVIAKRRKYKLIDYDVRTDKSKIDFVVNQLSELVDIPCIWAGTNDIDDPTVIYGYYVDWQQNIDSPQKCTATFKIRELV
jgi:hypothetical protein